MTRTGPADVVVSACARTVPARPGSCGLVSAGPASRGAAPTRSVFLGSASGKPASRRLAGQSWRPRFLRPPLRRQRAWAPHSPGPRLPALAYPLYLYLLRWHAATFYGWSFDPGRDILCILISPLRQLQWP
jgi:hypothetical protein